MIASFSLLVAAAAIAALVLAAVRWRRSVARLAALVERAERLAAGDRPSTSSRPALPAPERRVRDAESELDGLERALDRVALRVDEEVAAVEAERRKLDQILAGVPEGVLVTGNDRAPIYANRAFRELFDVDAGASTSELLALVRRPQVHEALGSATAGEVGPAIELQIGAREVSIVARRLEGLTGILLMARDVTEANRLVRMRRDFVTNLSHEIKTPLAVIRGAAETLQETGADDPEAAERFVRRIIEQIYRLEDLLKDLLTLARLESPEASQSRLPVDLAAVCRRAVEVLSPLAAREGVELHSTIGPVPTVRGDAKALERMVLNLLVNGIQYNRRGGHLALRLASSSGRIELEVEDDGVGIPGAELPRIFERFYRVDKGRGRADGGSGLGLAIVKHVAQSHGGTVDVSSGVDRGSRFRVVLPAAEPAADRATEVEAAPGERDRCAQP